MLFVFSAGKQENLTKRHGAVLSISDRVRKCRGLTLAQAQFFVVFVVFSSSFGQILGQNFDSFIQQQTEFTLFKPSTITQDTVTISVVNSYKNYL
jgi:hypothetical protein